MRTVESHRLPNLPLLTRITVSCSLLAACLVYASTWIAAVIAASWASGSSSLMQSWGRALANLAWSQPANYLLVLAVHAASLIAAGALAAWLFRRTSMRRRMRALLQWLSIALFVVDIGLWLAVPFLAPARPMAGVFAVGATLLLGLLTAIGLHQSWVFARWRSGGVRKRVVIVGGGFAGLYAALGLDRRLGYHPDLDIEVLDRRNYFLFPPLLPSVASGAIEPRQVANPFRRIFESTNVRFRKAVVESVDPVRCVVTAHVESAGATGGAHDDVEIGYDYLVLAPGSCTQTFQTPGVPEHAFFMKDLEDADAVRNQVIECFERAAAGGHEAARRELLTFVVVGAGPTGVEVATEIHDLIFEVLLARYPEIRPEWVQILLVQSGSQVLPGWRDSVVRIAAGRLSRLRCRTMLESRVRELTPTQVFLADGRAIPTRTCIWCAGVAASPLLKQSGLPLDRSGRIAVGADLRVEGFDNVFVLGDAALVQDRRSGRALPPLGQVAFQQGAHTSRSLVRLLQGRGAGVFRYRDHGALVSVGEHFAAVDLFGVQVSGFAGWLIWRTLYLLKMVGLGNRVRIVADWTLDLLIERSVAQTRSERAAAPSGVEAVEEAQAA